eukprot:SAG22_NODE_4398_length_1282_cov_2.201183_2_plen_98_part_00
MSSVRLEGLYLEELLALSELHGLIGVDGSSDGGPASASASAAASLGRMKAVVHKMLGQSGGGPGGGPGGASPSAARLASLAKAKLASGVTLAAVMAA